jgi:hypothetical protein
MLSPITLENDCKKLFSFFIDFLYADFFATSKQPTRHFKIHGSYGPKDLSGETTNVLKLAVDRINVLLNQQHQAA